MKVYFYKISNKEPKEESEFYIGSTNNMSRRKSHHKKNVHNKVHKKYWSKLYVYIRKQGGWDMMEMVKIHEIECDNLNDAHREEQAIIDLLCPTLNTIKSCKYGLCTTTYIKE